MRWSTSLRKRKHDQHKAPGTTNARKPRPTYEELNFSEPIHDAHGGEQYYFLPHPGPILRRRHHLRSDTSLVLPLPPIRPKPTATIPNRPHRTAMRCIITRYRRQTVHREVWCNSRRVRIRRRTRLPLNLDGIILRKLDTVMPKFERNISGPEVHFDDVIDAMVFWTGVPPVSVFEFEEGKREGGKVGFDFADGAAG